ncbi:uncharacterized protein BYT42DRAFT_615118 [Radiomyces spectabilis]|uniref:uncharacterized protein n=1 Tax=Radiomyces spectabilis TaxID=64574 RepID=UPI00222016F5|nr:uncharacterized protein BYT42DRAFT_615118 [Radiomyces spectabilis]KAI8376360.1 hypothetical protein BYT42DRAFT_615118 [Radiomyces spectabilis]
MALMDDDVWGSTDDDQDYDRSIAEKEWTRMNENHGNEGYKEGIIEGKEVHMQRGFDRGYEEGLASGTAIGRLRGMVSSYMLFYSHIHPDTGKAEKLKALYDEVLPLDVDSLYSKDYFSENSTKDADYISPDEHIHRWRQKVEQQLHDIVGGNP